MAYRYLLGPSSPPLRLGCRLLVYGPRFKREDPKQNHVQERKEYEQTPGGIVPGSTKYSPDGNQVVYRLGHEINRNDQLVSPLPSYGIQAIA